MLHQKRGGEGARAVKKKTHQQGDSLIDTWVNYSHPPLSPRPSLAQKQKFTFAAPSLSYAGAIVVAAPTKVGHAIQLPLEPNCLPANCSFYWHVIFN